MTQVKKVEKCDIIYRMSGIIILVVPALYYSISASIDVPAVDYYSTALPEH